MFLLNPNGDCFIKYKTPAEIAEDWGVSPQTVRKYICRYNIPVFKIKNKIFLVDGTPKPKTRSYRKRN